MNKNAKDWVTALRSGKYEQTTDWLHVTGDGYCCLGVACDLYQKSQGDLFVVGHSERTKDSGYVTSYSGCDKILPDKVRLWLGLSYDDGTYNVNERGEDGNLLSLANANDNGELFTSIADIIESEPSGLFFAQEDDDPT